MTGQIVTVNFQDEIKQSIGDVLVSSVAGPAGTVSWSFVFPNTDGSGIARIWPRARRI